MQTVRSVGISGAKRLFFAFAVSGIAWRAKLPGYVVANLSLSEEKRVMLMRPFSCFTMLLAFLTLSGYMASATADEAAAQADEIEAVKVQAAQKAADVAKAAAADADKPAVKADDAKADDAKAEEKKDAAKPAAPANPLQGLIRGIFGKKPAGRILPKNGGKPAVPPANLKPGEKPEEKDPEPNDPTVRDYIDSRAPHQRVIGKALARAELFMGEAESGSNDNGWQIAYDMLNMILHPPVAEAAMFRENPMVRLEGGRWMLATDKANTLLSRMPPRFLELYRVTRGPEAERKLAEAVKAGNLEQVAEVATRYYHTEAGRQAMNRLGSIHYDRGEFGVAARWFKTLIAMQAPVTEDHRWQLKAAIAFREAGNDPALKELLAQIGSAKTAVAGREGVVAAEWLESDSDIDEPDVTLTREWHTLRGNASRTGRIPDGEPLLLPKWSQPLSGYATARESVQTLIEDLDDVGTATLPAFTPITANGKVFFRTLRGVRAVDVASGRTLWETAAGLCPERILAGNPSSQQYANMQQQVFFRGGGVIAMQQGRSYYNGGNAEYDRLSSLLFRNGTWGQISTDGEQLFVLEEHAILSPFQPGNGSRFGNGNEDPFHRDFASNKIVAYDMNTGRPRWEVGGTAMDEPFDRRLAGQYFFGVPVADGDNLYVIGEKDAEIRLFCLAGENGRPRWSALLAHSDVDIQEDFGRRWWNVQPTISEGVVVCPTTVGWLVAVDPTHHSVIWNFRYSGIQRATQNRHSSREQERAVPQSPLNQQWALTAPIISDHHLVYAPHEEQTLVCVDLYTGKLVWQRSKDDALYVAGVHDGQVITVGKTSISAVRLQDNKPLWSTPHQTTAADGSAENQVKPGQPCGMGLIVGNTFYQPFCSGQLHAIDLADGKSLQTSYLPQSELRLGNLLMYQDTFLSLGPTGMTAFEQRESINRQIAERQKADPQDSWAFLKQAEIDLLNLKYPAALKLLQKVTAKKLTEGDQQRYRQAMIETLTQVIRSDFENSEPLFAELNQVTRTSGEKLLVQQLQTERLQAVGQASAAFDAYMKLADADEEITVQRTDDSDVSMPLSLWVTAGLHDLWKQASTDERARLDQRVAGLADAARSADTAAREHFVRLFGFHPLAIETRFTLARDYARANELALAHNHLQRLTNDPVPTVAAEATAVLADLFAEHGQHGEASFYWQQLAGRYPEVVLSSGRTGSEEVALHQQNGRLVATTPDVLTWSNKQVRSEFVGRDTSYNSQSRLTLRGDNPTPFFDNVRFDFRQNEQRLVMYPGQSNRPAWLVPLQTQQRSHQSNILPVERVGHLLFTVHSDVLHAISPVDRRVVWSYSIEGLNSSRVFRRNIYDRGVQAMQLASSVSPLGLWQQSAQSRGMLAVANAKYVCLHGRRCFTVLDTLTGEVRWRCDRVPAHTAIYGTEDVIFMMPQNQSTPTAFAALDGRTLSSKNLRTTLQQSITSVGPHLITMENKSTLSLLGIRRGNIIIRAQDPLRDQVAWEHKFSTKSRLCLLDDNRLAVLQNSGEFQVLNLLDGEQTTFTGLTETEMKPLTKGSSVTAYCVADRHHVYLLFNDQNRNGYYYGGGSLRSVKVNGLVACFSSKTREKLWHKTIKNTSLVLQYFDDIPVMLFSERKYERKGNFGYYSTEVIAIDKQTGKSLVNQKASTNYSGYQSMDVDLEANIIELNTYNQRLRLTAVDVPQTPARAQRPAARAEDPASTGE